MSTYGAKVLFAGVTAKAILMASVVTLLGATTFAQSVVLVLISATATGVFAILVVLIQVHSARELHERMNRIEGKTQQAVDTTQALADMTTGTEEKPK